MSSVGNVFWLLARRQWKSVAAVTGVIVLVLAVTGGVASTWPFFGMGNTWHEFVEGHPSVPCASWAIMAGAVCFLALRLLALWEQAKQQVVKEGEDEAVRLKNEESQMRDEAERKVDAERKEEEERIAREGERIAEGEARLAKQRATDDVLSLLGEASRSKLRRISLDSDELARLARLALEWSPDRSIFVSAVLRPNDGCHRIQGLDGGSTLWLSVAVRNYSPFVIEIVRIDVHWTCSPACADGKPHVTIVAAQGDGRVYANEARIVEPQSKVMIENVSVPGGPLRSMDDRSIAWVNVHGKVTIRSVWKQDESEVAFNDSYYARVAR